MDDTTETVEQVSDETAVAIATTLGVEAFEAAVEAAEAEETASYPPTLVQPEIQKLFDGQAIEELIKATRSQIAAGKVAHRLALINQGQGKHPAQIAEGLAKLDQQLAAALAMAAELDESTTGIAPPSDITVPDAATVSQLNRAQRRHPRG